MSSVLHRAMIFCLAVGLFAGVTAASAAGGHINDAGNFFSKDAIATADRKIDSIASAYRKEVTVDTFPDIPSNMHPNFHDDTEKRKFFLDWATRRAEDSGIRGVYILICKNPAHLECIVDRQTRQSAFTFNDRDGMISKMLPLLGNKQNDAALIAGLDFIQTALQSNARRAAASGQAPANRTMPIPAPAQSLPHPNAQEWGGSGLMIGLVCFGIVVILVLWLIFTVIRSMTRGSQNYGGPGPGAPGGYGPGGYGSGGGYGGGYGGGGGGGFMKSMVGGIFGAAAGNWLYDSFFRGNSGNMGGGYSQPGQGGNPQDPNQGAGDFSGDPGGGGDFGGNDSGGGGGDFGSNAGGGGAGDFSGDSGGGGDFGGGGGDFGGGGGDFGGGGGGDF